MRRGFYIANLHLNCKTLSKWKKKQLNVYQTMYDTAEGMYPQNTGTSLASSLPRSTPIHSVRPLRYGVRRPFHYLLKRPAPVYNNVSDDTPETAYSRKRILWENLLIYLHYRKHAGFRTKLYAILAQRIWAY